MKSQKSRQILKLDEGLKPFAHVLEQRIEFCEERRARLLHASGDIRKFANGYMFFGLHRQPDGWVYREWAPGADAMHLLGDFNFFNRESAPMTRLENGVWEIRLPIEALSVGQRILVQVTRGEEKFDRVPAWIQYATQEKDSNQYVGRVTEPSAYVWKNEDKRARGARTMYIYECHIGMAQEEGCVGSYRAFIDNVLPRIKRAGYNAIQIMAVQEHPYYASFGYQVTNFFAPSSWYGEPDGLRELIDCAHGMGMMVLMDLVHSHASKNARDGIADFDGSGRQYCCGEHPAWGSMLLDYGRDEVVHFLLSNIKYWMEEFHFDGFRFDGVTSMLYYDHGLERVFTGYPDYFGENTNRDALSYLTLACELIHTLRPGAVAIAEDMSGMPAMCLPRSKGGVGFDYRLNMGIPDLWIKLIKEIPQEKWDMFHLWHELTGGRPGEKSIAYAESHDQALVGDQTLLFRLLEAEIYTGMERSTHTHVVDKGIALSKLIKLLTLTLGGEGWLNFMGNEFGHPEWIDFPREGNGWSFHYARRQWSLSDRKDLKYSQLGAFDRSMLEFVKKSRLLRRRQARSLWNDPEKCVMAYEKAGLLFVFNLHPYASYADFFLPTEGNWHVVFDSDRAEFGGQERIARDVVYEACERKDRMTGFRIYLPACTALVMKKVQVGKGK